MSGPDPADLVALAASVAADAAALLLDGLTRARASVDTKSTGTDMVTEMDRAAERLVVDALLAARPDDGIVGEEGSHRAGSSGVQWLIDPIDGTISFVHRIPLFASLIALTQGSETLLAVVDLPALGRRFHALAGGGAWEGDRRLRVQHGFDPSASLVCHGNVFQFDGTGREELFQKLRRDVRLLRSYTDAFGHAMVASGAAALMVDPDLQPWDVAAPALLISEAGGQVYTEPERVGRPGSVFVAAGSDEAVDWLRGCFLQ